MKKIICTLQYLLLCFPLFPQGQIIHIPSDQPTIQSGINISKDGDTVLVSDGTYYENINFRGKAIIVASHFLIDEDSTHIDSTIINGSKPIYADSGSVVRFMSDEDTTSVLCGFTVTEGAGGYRRVHDVWGAGGIVISFSGGKIINNKIIKNSVIYSHPWGGGIVIDSPTKSVIIKNNYIAYNKVTTTAIQSGAGGIFCVWNSSEYILIADNIISHNSVINNINNEASNGGGISVFECNPNPIIRNNLIKNNYANEGGGIHFGGFSGNNHICLINNTIINNVAKNRGGGIDIGDEGPGIIKSINSIIWGNSAPLGSQINGEITIEYSDVEGGFEGNGNIDIDPQFADTTYYHLLPTSPCVNSGSPDSVYNDNDATRNDMGYLGGPSIVTSLHKDIRVMTRFPDNFKLFPNYPNPFNPSTTIEYLISDVISDFHVSNVTLKIYDILGKEVSTLVNKIQKPGFYEITWDASNIPSGVYFYKLTAGMYAETKKMILLR